MNKKIIIFGSSGHAKSIAVVLELLNYNIIGFIDSFLPKGRKILNYETLGDEFQLIDCFKNFGTNQIVIGVGSIEDRKNVVKLLKELNSNIEFPSIISPFSNVSRYSEIGQGSVILSNSFINVECKIGDFCIVNTASTIEHNTLIGDYCNISPGAVIDANVQIKPYTFIGASTLVMQKIIIGEKNIIKPGSVVSFNIPDII